MPDADFIGSLCLDSEWESLIAAGDKSPQDFNITFNTKGAEKLYIITDIRRVEPASAPTATVIQGSVSNISRSVDKDASVNSLTTTYFDQNPGSEPIGEYDFGSEDSTREVLVAWSSGATVPGVHQFWYRWADSGKSFSSWILIGTIPSGGSQPYTRSLIGSHTNMQFIQLRATTNQSTMAMQVHEIWDISLGLGQIQNQSIQINDTERSDWKDAPDIDILSVLDSSAEDKSSVKVVGITPKHNSQIRYHANLDAKANLSVQLVKVNPCE